MRLRSAFWRVLLLKSAVHPRPPLVDSLLTRYKFVLTNRTAMAYLVAQSLGFSVMITFVANAALVYIDLYGQSETVFFDVVCGQYCHPGHC
jgi:DHA1 family bicyclomycin/chloramphenicol resistance-like MFS transporter